MLQDLQQLLPIGSDGDGSCGADEIRRVSHDPLEIILQFLEDCGSIRSG
jgi:hypothetical protein